MSDAPLAPIEALVRAQSSRPAGAEALALSQAIRARHGSSVIATLFYGSCLRPAQSGDVGPGGIDERLYDFYALVDDLRAATSLPSALANWIMPPNVYYIEADVGGGKARAKYALLSLNQFIHGTSPRHFHNYFWGRFAQPAAIVHAADDATREKLIAALAQAPVTLLATALPLVGPEFDSATLWRTALAASYACELRPESADRAAAIYRADASFYDSLTAPALRAAGIAFTADGTSFRLDQPRGGGNLAWAARRAVGKSFNVLRLIKASFTFAGGIDYVVWKIERHSGIRPQLTPWQRRHPLLAGPLLAVRYWRKGAFR